MPLKQKQIHHRGSKKEKHTKRFLKAYAPYLPLIIIVGFGLFMSTADNFKRLNGDVLSYATSMSDNGLFDATNKARANNGLPALQFSPSLDQAAQAKAEDMAAKNYWSHVTPDGKEPWAFIDKAGYKYYKAAENLAYGFDNNDSTVIGWMNSPAHRANVLDSQLSEVGFGIVNIESYQNKGPQTIVVAMYGLPPPQTIGATPDKSVENSDVASSPFASTNGASTARTISYAQTLTGGSAPWISLVVGIGIGLMTMYLILKHTRNIARALKRGERFVLHHPLLDTTIIALLALSTVVAQTAGVIH